MTTTTEQRPHLHVQHDSPKAEAVVLVLHGGREASMAAVQPNQLAVLRMLPFAQRIARRGGSRVAVARLRYRVRGWNADVGPLPMPVQDANWALAELSRRFPDRPIGLVGHSMGGRTALRVGGHPAVRGVVGLAPWLNRGEPVEQLSDRRVLLMHGSADRMTSPRATTDFAARLASAGNPAGLIIIDGETHAMLRRPRLWHELSAQFVLSTVLPDYRPSGWPGAPNDWRQAIEEPARITY